MKKFRVLLTFFIFASLAITISACSSPENTAQNISSPQENIPTNIDDMVEAFKTMVIAEDENTITLLDARDREVTLHKNPERVIPMQNTLLNLWYLAGGTAIARVSGTTSVPEEAMDLPEIGKTASPNIELLLAADPDLIILNSNTNQHVDLEPILEENGIEYFYTGTSIYPYENVLKALYVFTRLTGNEEAYEENIIRIVTEVNDLIESTQEMESPSVLILFGSPKSVRVELENGLVGEMVNLLGGQNIVQETPVEGATKIDFSLETIVASDPDVILIVPMGDVEAVQDRIAEDIESNQAWASLTAVQNGNIHYLPSELYLYKPNGRYPEAFQGLYDILYP